jgi:hypothetical protein
MRHDYPTPCSVHLLWRSVGIYVVKPRQLPKWGALDDYFILFYFIYFSKFLLFTALMLAVLSMLQGRPPIS